MEATGRNLCASATVGDFIMIRDSLLRSDEMESLLADLILTLTEL